MISNILKYVDTLLQLSGRPGRRHKLWFKTVFAPKTLIVGCIHEEKEPFKTPLAGRIESLC